MKINYIDLYYTAIKNRDEKYVVDDYENKNEFYIIISCRFILLEEMNIFYESREKWDLKNLISCFGSI